MGTFTDDHVLDHPIEKKNSKSSYKLATYLEVKTEIRGLIHLNKTIYYKAPQN